MDIEVEGIVDVLVRSAERDSDGLKDSPDAKELERVAAETIGADHPDLGEAAGTCITRKSAASRSIFERDSARHAIVLVMPEDQQDLVRKTDGGTEPSVDCGRYGGHAARRRRRGRRWRWRVWSWARRPPADVGS